VRDLVLSRYPDPVNGRFVLCGDWNDTRTSKTVVTLTKGGSTPLGVVLPAADSHGETWTHFFRRDDSYSRIDYLLVSAALAPFVAGNQATVYDRAGVREASDHRPVVVRLQLEAEQ
jgi:endonuclease/exonuclease/phosphatase family metal-dependent hydrolase